MDKRKERGTSLSLSLKSTAAAVAVRQDRQTRRSLYQRTDGRAVVVGTHNGFSLPMAKHQAVFDLRRPQMDADQAGNLLSPILATAARASSPFL
nr:hypothetical protein [Halomonas venusta]